MAVPLPRFALLAVLALGGCSAEPDPSAPEEEPVETVDTRCGEVTARFEDDLAFGESFGLDDLDRLDQRVVLLEDLRDYARDTAPPGAELDAWLTSIDDLVESMETLATEMRNAEMGDDLLLSMRIGQVDNLVDGVGRAAAETGFDSCAEVERWRIFPPG